MPEPTLATVWLLGVSMGLTACTVTCLPFMGTWALGLASGQVEAFVHTGTFLAGRILAYTVLAALAGSLGAGLAQALGGAWGNALIGAASIAAGVWLLRPKPAGGRRGAAGGVLLVDMRNARRTDALPPLFLGAALSLVPCTPLATLLALAAQAGGGPQGAAYGLAFGLGAAMTPMLVLVPLAGRLGREMIVGRAWLSRWLTGAAAAVLVVLGLRRLWP
jgi:thiol:disulfide interchange protein DsbD